MKKLTQFRPQLITETFFSDVKPNRINHGQCFIWAYLAYKSFKGVELYDTNCHAFVRYNGRYYDSERPKGEKNWYDLPANKHAFDVPTKRKMGEFRSRWHSQTGRFETTWQEIDTKVKKIREHK
jgi:hypothetical protein